MENEQGILHSYVTKLYDKLDKSKLLEEVRQLREADPTRTPTDLARVILSEAKSTASSAGVASGMTSLLPVIGGLISLPTLGTEVAYLLAQEVYVILKIGAFFGFDPFDREPRLFEVFAILGREDPRAGSEEKGAEAAREAMKKLAGRGLVKIAQRASLRLGSRFLPIVGSVVGGLLNYSSIEEAGEIALRYYRSAAANKAASA